MARSVEMCRDEYPRVVVQGERGVDDVFRDHYDADVALAPGSPAAAYKRALLEAVLDHWNARGQDLAARLAAEPILAEGWLNRAP